MKFNFMVRNRESMAKTMFLSFLIITVLQAEGYGPIKALREHLCSELFYDL